MSEKVSVLVTAVCGDLGQAIAKALRIAPGRAIRVCGCDLKDGLTARLFVDEFAAIPKADDPNYIDALLQIASALGVQAIIPASEQEINRIRTECFVGPRPAIIVPRMLAGVLGSDKLSVYRALEGLVPLAPFADGADLVAAERVMELAGGCVVVKPRRGRGSKGMSVCRTREELLNALHLVDLPIVQGWFSGDEWSVGVYRHGGQTLACSLRRELSGMGLSMYAETLKNKEVEEYAIRIADVLEVSGAVNVQLRLTKNGPRLLEVNARFSSLTAARAASGFHDALWSVEDALGLPTQSVRGIQLHRLRIQRYFSEIVEIDGNPFAPTEWVPQHQRQQS